jgi:hypothetical protein
MTFHVFSTFGPRHDGLWQVGIWGNVEKLGDGGSVVERSVKLRPDSWLHLRMWRRVWTCTALMNLDMVSLNSFQALWLLSEVLIAVIDFGMR